MPAATVVLVSATAAVASVAALVVSVQQARTRGVHVLPGRAIVATFGVCAVLAGWRWMNHLVPLHHVMYIDEPWYLEAARSLLATGRASLCRATWEGLHCEPYPKSIGWPLLLAVVFRVAPVTDVTALLVSTALGALTVVTVGVGTARWTGRPSRGVLAALLVTLFPTHIAWSSTAETNVPGAAVLALALFAILAWIHSPRAATAVCGAALLALAASIRPEMSLAFAAFGVAILVARTRRRDRVIAGGTCVVFALLAVSWVWPMVRLNREISRGAFLALEQVPANFATLSRAPSLVSSLGVLVVLAALGTVVTVRARHEVDAVVLAGSGFAMALVVLAFDPRHFADRMLLGPMICLVPLAVTAGDLMGNRTVATALSALGVAAALVAARPAFDALGRVPESQSLETALPRLVRDTLPAQARVVSEWPTVLRAGTTVQAMSTRDALAHGAAALAEYAGTHEIYFACDMFCEEGFGGGTERAACAALVTHVGLRAVAAVRGVHRQFVLFRITNDPVSPAVCPARD